MAAITVARTSDSGAPQVGITVSGLSTVTSCTVVLEVSWDGGATWHAVRGGIVQALGSTFVRDFVPPLNVEALYRASVTGGTASVVTASVTVSSESAWMQDPLAPRSAVEMSATLSEDGLWLTSATGAQIPRPQMIDLVTPLGASLPVASIGTRRGPTDVPLQIRALAQAQASLLKGLRALLSSAGQLVLRGMPQELALDPVAHVGAGDVVEYPVTDGVLGALTTWDMRVTQVRPVSLRVVVPWWTYDQVSALVAAQVGSGATYAAVAAAMPAGKTYTDWLQDPGVV